MMPERNLLLGIDFGTGGCKVTVIDADWYAAMCEALKKLRAEGVDFSRIAALAFDGSTHNAVLMDAQMKPLRRTIMWTDQRSVRECAELKARAGEIFETAWQMPTPTWTLPQLMWIQRNEPEITARTEHILFVKDYVRYLVTGVAVTDYIEAQGTLFFDMKNNCWSQELAALTGIRAAAAVQTDGSGRQSYGGSLPRHGHSRRNAGHLRQFRFRRGRLRRGRSGTGRLHCQTRHRGQCQCHDRRSGSA